MSERASRAGLVIILAVYALLASLYAVETPAWQVPDEPAHYNYVVHVATENRLPVLEAGDFDAGYLEEIKARRFPPEMSVEPIRYESHQPPLYYILAAGVYRLAVAVGAPTLLALRLFSVALGVISLALAYRAVRILIPRQPIIALGATAFAATLPMHVAMTAGINNDVLTELILGIVAIAVLPSRPDGWTRRDIVRVGALLGLAFLTKMQSYVAFALACVCLYRDATGGTLDPRRLRWRHALQAAGLLGIAFVVASPWLVRNAIVYGLGDLLALQRHDLVVQGQLTTSDYLAVHGWPGLLRDGLQTTFQSFWGQFGWMGVLLDRRLYMALAVLSAAAVWGLVLYGARFLAIPPHERVHRLADPLLLTVWLLVPLAGYLWWNTRFVQHQGRYLFPALIPIGIAATVGLLELFRRPLRLTLIPLGIGIVILLVWGIVRRDLPLFPLALLLASGCGLYAAHYLHQWRHGLPLAVCYGGLAVLSALSLYVYILPALT